MVNFLKKIFRRKKMSNNIELKEIDVIIKDFLNSDKLKVMNTGDRYYKGNHDILNRVRKAIGKNGELVPVRNIPNNKIVDNKFTNVLDQKTDYLLSKNLSIVSENDGYVDKLNEIMNNDFLKVLHYLGKDAYKFGISFLYVYYNEKGKLDFKKLDAREMVPVWKDADHSELDYVIRIFKTQKFIKGYFKEITNVEVYTTGGIDYYIWDNALIPDRNKEHTSYIQVNDKSYNWERLPIIPFKANENEIALITRVKTIQDSINELISDFKNDMEQNSRNTILVIKNYDGEGGTLRHNMNLYGYVPVGQDGGVEALTIQVTAENYESILKLLKKSFIENAKGFDAKNDKLFGNANQMNIQSMYSDIDLDASALEREFKTSLNKLIWFINQYLGISEEIEVDFVFNKDILINESQAIDECQKSRGVISHETILAQHPWVTDVELELSRIEDEKEKELKLIEGGSYGGDAPDLDE